MSQTTTPDGVAGHRDDALARRDEGPEPRRSTLAGDGGGERKPVSSLVAGVVVCVIAAALLAAGGWGLWKDRVDRDGEGFVSFGTSELRTEQYAIVGDLRGDGPSWIYGSTVLGDQRVRATSRGEAPLFIGIGRKDDVLRYLRGVGYATVDSFEVRADTTHPGDPPSGPGAEQSFWATSTEGDGQQTLLWSPRSGDWSVVFMNADGSAVVDVRGDASAKVPLLPWIAGGLLVIGAVVGLMGARVLVRARRHGDGTRSWARESRSEEGTT